MCLFVDMLIICKKYSKINYIEQKTNNFDKEFY